MCPTLDPIENTPSKGQVVPQYNKKEIEAIIKNYLVKNPELLDEALANRSNQEFLDSYPKLPSDVIVDGEAHELTPEIKDAIIHAIKVGKLNLNGAYLSLNTLSVSGNLELESVGDSFNVCFGCMNTNQGEDHTQIGAHIEIYAHCEEDGNYYQVLYNEV